MKYLLLLLVACQLYSAHIVIIGAGPTGLAAAIEAKQQGHDVTVIEKRSDYTRLQSLFMNENSVRLLKEWQIDLPQMHLISANMGVVPIKHLQDQLEKKAIELGAIKIVGEFEEISPKKITLKNNDSIAYDLLVAADGTHSKAREALNVEVDHQGKGVGISAFVPKEDKSAMEISEPIKMDGLFLRRFKASFGSLIFAQGPSAISHEHFVKAVKGCGWGEEADFIAKNRAWVLADIDIQCFQCKTFIKDNAILIGDAAASASFFEGMGANTGLKAAKIAGEFFADGDRKAFDRKMKEATDFMMEDSRYLFVDKITALP
jgi:2-polyprenyl-6-methoxyphenol hydroxylase-like FAD-dependent oxidoreductase